MVHGEPDWTGRYSGKIDHWYIKGVTFKDPSIASSLPISIENPALAYEAAKDIFRINIMGFKGTPSRRYNTASGEVKAAPSAGNKLKVFGVLLVNEADEIARLRYGGVSGVIFMVLPSKGVMAMNLVNVDEYGGDAQNIYLEKTGSGNSLAVVWTETVAS